ncbi:hypothetical protein M422DRAFT_44226 [Sphaerobolus stellatus SS14]|nr:hypothetical protein M422DRAFT_44226 [Sphaerobolus stellatus SS14]
MHSRRHLPALALVMPHPELPTVSPCTPRACTPTTPLMLQKQQQYMASPRTSMESWGSSSGQPEDEIPNEWKPEHIVLLSKTLDALPHHLYTPFNGLVPPSNLLDRIARSIANAKGFEWPHSIRQTRIKLVEIVRGRNKENMHMTIDEADEDVAKGDEEHPMKPSKLHRQSSMDFLPSKGKDISNLTKLSSRLQRADRFIPTYHPYARPTSRTPSPVQRAETESYPFPPSIATATRTRSVTISLQPMSSHMRPRMLRRTASTLSNALSDVSMGSIGSAGSGKPSKPALPKRSDSFSVSETTPGLKRAPSYGSAMDVDSPVEDAKSTLTRSRKEKVAEVAVVETPKKRARSRSATASPVSSSPERKKTKKTEEKNKDTKVSPKSSSRSKSKSSSSSSERSSVPSSPTSSSTSSSPKSTITRMRSSTAMLPTVSSAAKQQTNVATRMRTSSTVSSSAPYASTTISTRTSFSTRTRSGSMFGPPLPVPQPPTVLPTCNPTLNVPVAFTPETRVVSHSTSTSNINAVNQPSATSQTATKQKTLRRVRTTAFPGRMPSVAKRISFNSLVANVEEDERAFERKQAAEKNKEGAARLGSAFEMA